MKVIYYYHVPKCSGTFIMENLRRICENTSNAVWCRYNRNGILFRNPQGVVYTNNATKFETTSLNDISPDQAKDFDKGDWPSVLENLTNLNYEYVYMYQHHSWQGLKDLSTQLQAAKQQVEAAGGTFYLFTCIRETLPFVNSYVNYIKNDWFAQHALSGVSEYNDFRDRWSFDAAVNEAWFNNYQSKYLLHNHEWNWTEDITVNQEEMTEIANLVDKIYVTKNISKLKTDLINLSIPNVESQWSDDVVNASTKLFTMTEEQGTQLTAKNQLDTWLYDNHGYTDDGVLDL